MIGDAVPVVVEGPTNVSEHKSADIALSHVSQDLNGTGLRNIAVERIVPSRHQPRRAFGEEAIKGLAESIRASGLMQPVIVRRGSVEGEFELVAGERRWRAAKVAGLAAIPAIVRELSDAESAQWGLVENVQREDLNPMDKAWGFRALAEKFGLTQGEIAERVGLDRASVANLTRLTELEEAIQKLLELGELSAGHGKALLGCAAGLREKMARRAVEEGWSVRRLERECAAAAAAVVGGKGGAGKSAGVDAKLAARVALEKQLGEHLGTKVQIQTDRSGTKGKLVIEFYGLDHFDGLLERMGFRMR